MATKIRMNCAIDMMNDNKSDDVRNGDEVMIDPSLMDILVCPIARCPLVYNAETNELISVQARKAYPVRDGVPIMLIDEARDLDNNDVPA